MHLSGFNRNNGDVGLAENITKSYIALVQRQKSRLNVSSVCTWWIIQRPLSSLSETSLSEGNEN